MVRFFFFFGFLFWVDFYGEPAVEKIRGVIEVSMIFSNWSSIGGIDVTHFSNLVKLNWDLAPSTEKYDINTLNIRS